MSETPLVKTLQSTTAITLSGLLPSIELVIIMQAQARMIDDLAQAVSLLNGVVENQTLSLELATSALSALAARVEALEAP